MKFTKFIAILLSCVLSATLLLACAKDNSESPETTPSTDGVVTTPTPTTTNPPVTTPPTTSPATTTSPETTPPPVTDPSPDAPLDYSALSPSQLYDALLKSDGFTVSIQNGPYQTTCAKAGDLLYLHRWNDQIALDEESYTDLSEGDSALISALASIELTKDTYWLSDNSYDSFTAGQSSLTVNSDVMAQYDLELAILGRNGTTYTYFVSDTEGESVKITLTFEVPEIERS